MSESAKRIRSVRTRLANHAGAHNQSKLRALVTRSKNSVNKALVALERARCARNLTKQEEEAVRVMKCEREEKGLYKGKLMSLLYDSGSDAHITNDRSVFESTLRSCSVDVFGISEDESVQALKATECGDVSYSVGEKKVVLRDVLFVPSAVLGDNPRTVLVSVWKFVSECGLGVHFAEGGRTVEFTTGSGSRIEVKDEFKSNSKLYIDKTKTTVRELTSKNVNKREREGGGGRERREKARES